MLVKIALPPQTRIRCVLDPLCTLGLEVTGRWMLTSPHRSGPRALNFVAVEEIPMANLTNLLPRMPKSPETGVMMSRPFYRAWADWSIQTRRGSCLTPAVIERPRPNTGRPRAVPSTTADIAFVTVNPKDDPFVVSPAEVSSSDTGTPLSAARSFRACRLQ